MNEEEEIWEGDLLGRAHDARAIIDFLSVRTQELKDSGETSSYVLNLDAVWGNGKTFFLTRLRRQLEAENYMCVYINAWETDHADDPLIPVMAEIQRVFEPYLNETDVGTSMISLKKNMGRIALAVGKGLVSTAVKRYVGAELEELVDDGQEQESGAEQAADSISNSIQTSVDKIADEYSELLISQFEQSKNSIQKFRSNLKNLVEFLIEKEIRKYPMFILIDELDRCRPTYAISLLERVKHLFSTDGVVFIVATDSKQLRHSIRGAYGGEFDGAIYLRRFFDRVYQFSEPDLVDLCIYFSQKINRKKVVFPSEDIAEILVSFMKFFDVSIRDMHQIFDYVSTSCDLWARDYKMEGILLLLTAWLYHSEQKSDFFDIIEFVKKYRSDNKKDWKANIIVNDYNNSSYDDRSNPHKLNMFAILDILYSLADNISENHGSRGENFEAVYAFDIISPEWNGRPIVRGQKSVQFEISNLVRTAGRFAK